MATKHNPRERFMLFNMGWKLGARVGPTPNDARGKDTDFRNGYEEGRITYNAAMQIAATCFGHKRSILCWEDIVKEATIDNTLEVKELVRE